MVLPVDSFRPHQITTLPPPSVIYLRGRLDEPKAPLEQVLFHRVDSCIVALMLCHSWSHSWSSQLIGLRINPSQWCQQQSRLNYNQTIYRAHTGLAQLGWVTWPFAQLTPTGHLLHKATLPSLRDVAAVTNKNKPKGAAKMHGKEIGPKWKNRRNLQKNH